MPRRWLRRSRRPPQRQSPGRLPFISLLFGRETVGQLETVTDGVPALA